MEEEDRRERERKEVGQRGKEGEGKAAKTRRGGGERVCVKGQRGKERESVTATEGGDREERRKEWGTEPGSREPQLRETHRRGWSRRWTGNVPAAADGTRRARSDYAKRTAQSVCGKITGISCVF